MMMAGAMHPPFSLFGCAEKRKRAVHGPKEKRRFGGTWPPAKVHPCTGALPARCPGNWGVFGLPSRRSLVPRGETADRGCWEVNARSPLLIPRFRAAWAFSQPPVFRGPHSVGPGPLAGPSLRNLQASLRGAVGAAISRPSSHDIRIPHRTGQR